LQSQSFKLLPHLPTPSQFWDDPADGGAPGDAALLPLWRFAPTAARGRAATALAWCPAHAGLFAVGFGSFDPGSGAAGAVALVALASGGPGGERAARLPAGVLSLDWSAAAPRLLAVGCADGSVHVLDAGTAQDAPAGDAAGAGAGAAAGSGGACGATTTASPYGGLALRASSAPETRLGEGCWAVRWARGGGPGEPPALLTASPDGALVRWELGRSSVLARREAAPLGAPLCTLDAHPAAPGLLLVGTQAGEALRFDADAGGAPPAAFRPAAAAAGAAAPLVAARWSPTHPSAFLAAGADWRLRVHDAARPGERAPVRLELGGAAADAAWGPATWAGGGAPTLLAAALEGGRVAVFDLARDAAAPLCVQKVAAGGTRLTRLEFHPTRPALLVGDDRGGATLLKLPPSLRGAAVAEAAAPAAAAAAATAAAARAGARGGPPPQYRRPAARAEGGGGAGAPAMPAARLEAALEEGRRRAAAAAAFPAAMAAADAAARRPSVA
jgi:dynein intermediate chain 1